MADDVYRTGDRVEVNIAGLEPVTATEVLIDPEAHDDWHPAEIMAVHPDGTYDVLVLPLVGAIEVPPVDASRLRRR
jgi:hypothetical protein